MKPKPFPSVTLSRVVLPARESWWIGHPREGFQQRALAEAPRMNLGAGASYCGWIVIADSAKPKPNRGFGIASFGEIA